MLIQPVNMFSGTNFAPVKKQNNVNNKNFQTSLSDTLSFTGTKSLYTEVLKETINTTFLKDIDIEKSINKLFSIITNDERITKLNGFDFIEKLYKENGLRGMMRELWTETPQPATRDFLNQIGDDLVPLVKKDDKPLLEICNIGPQGFLDFMKENKNAKRNVDLIFSDYKDKISLSLRINKKGGYSLSQNRENASLHTDFYASTGKRKREVYQYRDSKPDTTYFNEDGSKAFFKNWFFGGTPTEPMY